MALRPLTPAVRQPLENGWDLIVSQAGVAGRGLRLMITTMNGDPKAQHSVGVGVKTEEQRFIDDVVGLTALDAATISKALVTLAYNAEGVWREQRPPQGTEDTLPGKPLAFDELDPWETPVDGAVLLDALQATYARCG